MRGVLGRPEVESAVADVLQPIPANGIHNAPGRPAIRPLKNRTSLRYASSALPRIKSGASSATYESTPQSHLLACLNLLALFLGLKRWVFLQSAHPTIPSGAGGAMHASPPSAAYLSIFILSAQPTAVCHY